MGHPNLVRSHHRTLQRGLHATLDAVLDLKERLNLTDVVEKTGLSASTAHRIIRGLERRDYLSRNEDTKRYSLGARIAYLGSLAENRSDDGLREKAYEYLVKIRDRIYESASLYVRDGASRICIDRVESKQLLRWVITVGERLPLPNGATGKVLMSGMEDRELMELLGEDYEAVKPDVDKVRERGYWVSNGEREVGLSAIAAPVYNAKGKMIAAISISGPTARIIDEELAEKVQSVLECAGDISRQMGYFK